MSSIVFVFGPSCSGKSTLCEALLQDLGNGWQCVDRDDLIEKRVCSEEDANVTLDKKVRSIGTRVIVDAQIPWRKKEAEEFYFLVLPPLEILLERDRVRTLNLKRTPHDAHWAKDYVIETHQILATMKETNQDFDHCFDSSQTSVQKEVEKIRFFVLLKTVIGAEVCKKLLENWFL